MKHYNEIKRTYTIEDLEELLDNIPYELFIKDKNGVYIYANRATAQCVGLKKEEVIGKNDYEIRPYDAAKSCVNGDEFVLNRGDGFFIEQEVVNDEIKTTCELYKALLYKDDKDKAMIGGITKRELEDKTLWYNIMGNSNNITNCENELNSKVCYDEILKGLKTTINSDDVALYLYDKSERKMKLRKHIGINTSFFESEYNIDDESNLENCNNYKYEIKEEYNYNSVRYKYILKNDNAILGCLHIYYRNKPLYIKEEFIRYICLVLSFTEANRILTESLNEEFKSKNETKVKLQTIIDSIIDIYAIIQKDDENEFKCIEISERCTELMGWDVDEINNKYYLDFIHPKDKERIKSAIEGKSRRKGPFSMKRKDGKWIVIEGEFSRLTDNLYMITAKDVTNITKLEKDKEHLKQVVEVETLKSEFFANMSHEFKTPLNIILSTIQVILQYMKINNEYPNIEVFNRYINNIKQNSYRLLKLANNLIDISKMDGNFYQIDMGNYNIVELVENIVQSLAVYIKENKRNIIFDTMEEEVITACDPDQIERIILNLFSNAMKFTSVNGNIYVNMDVNKQCNKVIIKVANDGQPISVSESEKIFDRFTQSENILTRSKEGSGIGLAIVKSLVELHKGTIYVNTEYDKGVEFCIELPIRKIRNSKHTDVRRKKIISKVERFDIEFSDIYT